MHANSVTKDLTRASRPQAILIFCPPNCLDHRVLYEPQLFFIFDIPIKPINYVKFLKPIKKHTHCEFALRKGRGIVGLKKILFAQLWYLAKRRDRKMCDILHQGRRNVSKHTQDEINCLKIWSWVRTMFKIMIFLRLCLKAWSGQVFRPLCVPASLYIVL